MELPTSCDSRWAGAMMRTPLLRMYHQFWQSELIPTRRQNHTEIAILLQCTSIKISSDRFVLRRLLQFEEWFLNTWMCKLTKSISVCKRLTFTKAFSALSKNNKGERLDLTKSLPVSCDKRWSADLDSVNNEHEPGVSRNAGTGSAGSTAGLVSRLMPCSVPLNLSLSLRTRTAKESPIKYRGLLFSARSSFGGFLWPAARSDGPLLETHWRDLGQTALRRCIKDKIPHGFLFIRSLILHYIGNW